MICKTDCMSLPLAMIGVGVGFLVWTRAVALFTSILRPSTTVPLSCSRALSASALAANVTKPKP